MTITLAFDSFKGSLTSEDVADAFQEGLLSVLPHSVVNKVYIADGGEGTTEALVRTMHGEWCETTVSDPLGRDINARYGIIPNRSIDGYVIKKHDGTAIMEMASASGLPLLSPEERNPMKTTTYGTGQLIAHAINQGCRKLLIGIGGSATNDGGTGMLRALGYRFLDKDGQELAGGGEILGHIHRIDASLALPQLSECQFTVACDVDNPLYGPNGAAHVFAPQKGADAEMVALLDKGLHAYAEAIQRSLGKDIAHIPGAGAAGGMGAGMIAMLDARLMKGIDLVLDAINFDGIIKGSDLVVTGEGRIDRQTLMGKAPGGVLKRATAQGIPTIAVGGCIQWCRELQESSFKEILSINPDNLPEALAMQHDIALENVRRTGRILAEYYTKQGWSF